MMPPPPDLTPPTPYRFPSIRPVLPRIEHWAPFLNASYQTRWFSNFGPVVRQFEAALTARFCHPGEVMLSTNSATSGIAAALVALGVRGPVIIPAFTFPATASAVVMAGAEPTVLDVDLETGCLALPLLEEALCAEKCDAVVLVAPFGIQQDFTAWFKLCDRHGAALVIDNAAGLGVPESSLPGARCFEVYSMHATKSFAIGEGGAIRAGAEHAEALRRALNFGLRGPNTREDCWGINGKLPEVSAAIGLAVLHDLDETMARRRAGAQRYLELLRDFPQVRSFAGSREGPWQVFPMLLPSAVVTERLVTRAAALGLHIRRGYEPSLEDWPRTRKFTPCPNALILAERMASLPVYADATDAEMNEMEEIVRTSLGHAFSL
ncbi:MAG: DegT/DnrJ/EryC1/StrS family aminotransferase [Chthoniobacterales bacterium]